MLWFRFTFPHVGSVVFSRLKAELPQTIPSNVTSFARHVNLFGRYCKTSRRINFGSDKNQFWSACVWCSDYLFHAIFINPNLFGTFPQCTVNNGSTPPDVMFMHRWLDFAQSQRCILCGLENLSLKATLRSNKKGELKFSQNYFLIRRNGFLFIISWVKTFCCCVLSLSKSSLFHEYVWSSFSVVLYSYTPKLPIVS